jgi:hypothetical protein
VSGGQQTEAVLEYTVLKIGNVSEKEHLSMNFFSINNEEVCCI